MQPAVTCPQAPELEQLVRGQIADARAEEVEAHLESCQSCLEKVKSLMADDTLVGAAKAGSTSIELHDAPANVDDWIRKFKAMAAAGSGDPGDPRRAQQPSEATAADSRVEQTCLNPSYPPTKPSEVTTENNRLKPEPLPERFGRYRILGRAGAGGMGTVFRAEDTELHRIVAVKVPHLADRGEGRGPAVERFLREARLAAKVRHPHVCSIHDVGEHGGVPYVVMAYVEGPTLADRLAGGRPLDMNEVTTIGRQVAEALEAIHQHGVVHRDLKPHNVLLEGPAQAVLTDFGLARPVKGGDRLTGSGAVVGTPAYMAPEQARGAALDHRADLFSLGCVLYQMCTGRRAFTGSDAYAILTSLATETPPSAITLNPALPPALSELIARLMSKDPEDRPQTAREVADALGRIAAGGALTPLSPKQPDVPVLQGRPRRWKAVVAGAVALVGLGLALAYGATIIRIVMNEGELVIVVDDPNVEVLVKPDSAEILEKSKKRRFILKAGAGVVEFYDPETGVKAATEKFRIERGGVEVVTATVARAAVAQGGKATDKVRGEAPDSVGLVHRLEHGETILCIAVSPDGRKVAAGSGREYPHVPEDMSVRVWNLKTGEQLHRLGHPYSVRNAAFSADGRKLISSTAEGRAGNSTLHVWDADTGQSENVSKPFSYGAMLCRDGRYALGANQTMHELLDLKTGQIVARTKNRWGGGKTAAQLLLPQGLAMVAVQWPAKAEGETDLQIHHVDFQTGKERIVLEGRFPAPRNVYRIASDGRWIWFEKDKVLRLWHLAGDKKKRELVGHEAPVQQVEFSPDGKRLLSADTGGTVRLWDWESGRTLHSFAIERDDVLDLAFTPDGRYALGAVGYRLYVWRLPDPATPVVNDYRLVGKHAEGTATIWGTAVSKDGRVAISSGRGPWVDRKVGFAESPDRFVRVWEVATGKELRKIEAGGHGVAVALSPDGRFAFIGPAPVDGSFWDLQTGKQLWTCVCPSQLQDVAFSPDGSLLALPFQDATIRLLDANTGKKVRSLVAHQGLICRVAFSPDGRRLAALGHDDRTLRVWDVATGDVVRAFEGHTDVTLGLAFLPKGDRIVTCGHDRSLRLWDVEAGKAVWAVRLPDQVSWHAHLALSADGRYAAVSFFTDKTIRVFELETQQEVARYAHVARRLFFLPGGKLLSAGIEDPTLRLWQVFPADDSIGKTPAPFPIAGDERKVVEWILSLGGKVTLRLGTLTKEFEPGDRLPARDFELMRIDLAGNHDVIDNGLANLRGLPHLHWLDLGGTGITNAGLVHLRDLPKLRSLFMGGVSGVTDAGFVHLTMMPSLTQIGVGPAITDAGLDHLAAMPNLEGIWLHDMQITSAGLAKLKTLQKLWWISLYRNSKITDAGLEHLKGHRLKILRVENTPVGDAALEHLSEMITLEELHVPGTRVSDVGLKALYGLKNLRTLDLSNTKVTAAGVAALKKALPACKVITTAGE